MGKMQNDQNNLYILGKIQNGKNNITPYEHAQNYSTSMSSSSLTCYYTFLSILQPPRFPKLFCSIVFLIHILSPPFQTDSSIALAALEPSSILFFDRVWFNYIVTIVLWVSIMLLRYKLHLVWEAPWYILIMVVALVLTFLRNPPQLWSPHLVSGYRGYGLVCQLPSLHPHGFWLYNSIIYWWYVLWEL